MQNGSHFREFDLNLLVWLLIPILRLIFSEVELDECDLIAGESVNLYGEIKCHLWL
jgi:hypothetical protein